MAKPLATGKTAEVTLPRTASQLRITFVTTPDRPFLAAAAIGGPRMDWDRYFLTLAEAAATRSTCTNRQVGAVIVKGRHLVATGYNGGPRGYGHCDEGACPRSNSGDATGWDYANCIAIHAEANAIMFSSPEARDGATIYTSTFPCFECAKLLANSGINEVVAHTVYDNHERVKGFMQDAGLRVRVLDPATTPLL
ncbi:MAG: dCMP deaminase [Glaciecola sp.]